MSKLKASVIILSLILFTSLGTSITTDFSEGLGEWKISEDKFTGDKTGSESYGSYSEEYEGSVNAHVEGSPGGLALYKEIEEPISAGTELKVKYKPSDGSWSAGGPSLNLKYPDSENVRLENENQNTAKDGELSGKVPKRLPEGGFVVVGNAVWPGEYEIYFTEVLTEGGESEEDNTISFEEKPFSSITSSDSLNVIEGKEKTSGKNGYGISSEHTSRGSKALHLASYGDLDPIKIGFKADLTNVEKIVYDGYDEANNAGAGDIKVFADSKMISNDLIFHPMDEPPVKEDVWHRDISADVSDIEGEKMVSFRVRGNGNDAYFDNIRFLNSEGKTIKPGKVLSSENPPESGEELIFEEDFENGLNGWENIHGKGGKIVEKNGEKALWLHEGPGQSNSVDNYLRYELDEEVKPSVVEFTVLQESLCGGYCRSNEIMLKPDKELGEGTKDENNLIELDFKHRGLGSGQKVTVNSGAQNNLNSNPFDGDWKTFRLHLNWEDKEIEKITINGEKAGEKFDFQGKVDGIKAIDINRGYYDSEPIWVDNVKIYGDGERSSNPENRTMRDQIIEQIYLTPCEIFFNEKAQQRSGKPSSYIHLSGNKNKSCKIGLETESQIISKLDVGTEKIKSLEWQIADKKYTEYNWIPWWSEGEDIGDQGYGKDHNNTGYIVDHTFKNSGSVRIKLSVELNNGNKDTKTRYVEVKEKTVPKCKIDDCDKTGEIELDSIETSKEKIEVGETFEATVEYVNSRDSEVDGSISLLLDSQSGGRQVEVEEDLQADNGKGSVSVKLKTVETSQSEEGEGVLKAEETISAGIYDIEAELKDSEGSVLDTVKVNNTFEVIPGNNRIDKTLGDFLDKYKDDNQDFIALSHVQLDDSKYHVAAIKGRSEPGNRGFVRAQLSIDDGDWESLDKVLVVEETENGYSLAREPEKIEEVISVKSALYWSNAVDLEEPNEWAVETNRHMLYGDSALGYNAFITEGTKETLFKTDKERYEQVLTKMVSSSSNKLVSEDNLAKIQNARDLASAAKEAKDIADEIEEDSGRSRTRKKIMEKTGDKLQKISDQTEKVDAVMPVVSLVVEISTQEEYKQKKVDRLSRVVDYAESSNTVELDSGLKQAIEEIEERESTDGKTSEMIVADFISWSKDEGIDLAKYGGKKFAESGMADDLGNYLTSHSTTLSSSTSSSTLTTVSSVASAGGAALQGWELGGVATSRQATFEALKKAEYSRKSMKEFEEVNLDIKQKYGKYSNINNDYGETALGSDTELSKDYMAARFLRRRSMCEFNNQMLNSLSGFLNWIPDATNWFEEQYAKYDDDWNPRDEKEMMEKELQDCRNIAEWMRSANVNKITESYPDSAQETSEPKSTGVENSFNSLIGSIGKQVSNIMEKYILR